MRERHRLVRTFNLRVFMFLWWWCGSAGVCVWFEGCRGYRSMSRVTWSLRLWRTTDEAFWEIPEDPRWTPLGVNYTSICFGITRSPISSRSLCMATLVFLKHCWTALSFTFWSRLDQRANRQLCFDDSRGGGSAKDSRAAEPPDEAPQRQLRSYAVDT